MKSVPELVEEMKQALPGLPAIVVLVVLALGAGWLGGRWAAPPSSPSPPGALVPDVSLDMPAANQSAGVQVPTTEPAPLADGSQGPVAPTEEPVKQKPYLGMRAKAFSKGNIKGVKITEVFPDSPAARGGLRSDKESLPEGFPPLKGDTGHVIIGANGHALRSEDDLRLLLTQSAAGEVVEFLAVFGNGDFYEVLPVTLGAAAEPAPGEQAVRDIPQ